MMPLCLSQWHILQTRVLRLRIRMEYISEIDQNPRSKNKEGAAQRTLQLNLGPNTLIHDCYLLLQHLDQTKNQLIKRSLKTQTPRLGHRQYKHGFSNRFKIGMQECSNSILNVTVCFIFNTFGLDSSLVASNYQKAPLSFFLMCRTMPNFWLACAMPQSYHAKNFGSLVLLIKHRLSLP